MLSSRCTNIIYSSELPIVKCWQVTSQCSSYKLWVLRRAWSCYWKAFPLGWSHYQRVVWWKEPFAKCIRNYTHFTEEIECKLNVFGLLATLGGLMVRTPMCCEPSLVLAIREVTDFLSLSVCWYTCLNLWLIAGGETELVGGVKYLLWLVLLFIPLLAGCGRPGLAQREAIISVKVLVV